MATNTETYGAPFIYNGKQSAKSTNEGGTPTPNDSIVMQSPFDRAVRIFKDGGQWYKKTADGTVAVSGNYYTPDFVVTGIVINDNNEDGNYVGFDIPHLNELRVRFFPGLDRPYRVTRLYFGEAFTNATDIILLG